MKNNRVVHISNLAESKVYGFTFTINRDLDCSLSLNDVFKYSSIEESQVIVSLLICKFFDSDVYRARQDVPLNKDDLSDQQITLSICVDAKKGYLYESSVPDIIKHSGNRWFIANKIGELLLSLEEELKTN